MRNRILPAALLLALFILAACYAQAGIREATPIRVPGNNLDKGACKDSPTYSDPDSIAIIVSGNDITVFHFDAFYNCCLTVTTEVAQEGYVINLYEHESGDNPCYCLCYYDLETTIYDLEAGTYTINVYSAEGEYVGGGTATIEDGAKGYDPVLK